MTRRVNPFSIGLYVGLFALFILSGVATFYAGHVLALSNNGPDTTDFDGNAWYTLSDTHDVKNTRSMGLTLYRQGALPAGPVTVNVTYRGGAVTCVNQAGQGNAGVHFSYGNGSGFRQTSLTIPVSAWVSNGVGYTADISANIVDGDNTCQGAENGNHVNFKLSAPSGYIIGPDSSKNFAVVQNAYCVSYSPSPAHSCNDYGTYNIPFGPPCTQTNNGSATVRIFDMDNKNSPVIQPTPAVVKIIDTTTGAVVNNNSSTGSQGNGGTANFQFNYTALHNYRLQISNLNMNNVLQLQLPFDSVNAIINCAPKGGITSSAAAACTAIQGWTYDVDSTATKLQYYVYVNPSSAPTTLSGPIAANNFVGPFTANLANPAGTPAGTPAGHGLKVNIPSQVQGHGYNGAWVANSYYIYAKDASSNNLQRVASVGVPQGTCASVSCGTSNFAIDTVGEPTSFNVNMKVNGGATDDPPGASFTIHVTGPNNQNYTGVNDNLPSGGYIYSDSVSFTPTASGIYNVTWSYYGTNCGGVSDKAAFAPFFQSLGGDTAAGAGFGNGCTENTAIIKSWNLNTDFTPNYYGAGSETAAWATGTISNFVSGMGLTGGAAASSGYGLSFANTSNTGGGNYGGNYGTGAVPCLYDYYGNKPATTTNLPTGSLTSFTAPLNVTSGSYNAPTVLGGYTVGSGADMTLGQDPAGNGRQIDIYVNGNLYINSNIKYSYGTLYQIPKISFFVKGNIYINPNVTELHGVYIAQNSASGGGRINTCATGMNDNTQSYATCNKQLRFVGAVAAESGLRLVRTFGNLISAGGVTNQPAEVVQYSPELWLASPAGSGFKYQAYTSLPPVL
jgi:hypothetical protein